MSYDATEILMKILAGLGLFFFGLKMVTENLTAVAGDRFRRGLEQASGHPGASALFGATAGFVTQSGRTTSFIMASFIQAGLINARRALPIVLWSNFGCTLVVFTAVFPVYLFALFLLAVAGVCIAFERPKPLLNAASAVFGLALLLFGLQMMSSSAPVLTGLAGFSAALAFIKTSLVLAFLMGLVLTLVAQSHIAILMIAIALAGKGVFDFDQTVMVMFGALAGSSVITYVTGVHFRGQPRQVVAGQTLYSLVGLVLFLPLFAIAHVLFERAPTAFPLLQRLGASPGMAAAGTVLAFNLATPLVLMATLPAFERLCARLAPPLGHEDLARPEFLRAEVSGNAVATLLLAEQEQLRLLRRMPGYLAWIRGDDPARAGPSPELLHAAFRQVGAAIARAQAALTTVRMTPTDTEWLINQQKRQELLAELDGVCHSLWETAATVGSGAAPLRDTIVEALDALLLTAISGVESQDGEELEMLETMTRDRGPAMERMRSRYLAASEHLRPDERSGILQITSLFERAAWALHRLSTLVRTSPGWTPKPSPAGARAEADPPLPETSIAAGG